MSYIGTTVWAAQKYASYYVHCTTPTCRFWPSCTTQGNICNPALCNNSHAPFRPSHFSISSEVGYTPERARATTEMHRIKWQYWKSTKCVIYYLPNYMPPCNDEEQRMSSLIKPTLQGYYIDALTAKSGTSTCKFHSVHMFLFKSLLWNVGLFTTHNLKSTINFFLNLIARKQVNQCEIIILSGSMKTTSQNLVSFAFIHDLGRHHREQSQWIEQP